MNTLKSPLLRRCISCCVFPYPQTLHQYQFDLELATTYLPRGKAMTYENNCVWGSPYCEKITLTQPIIYFRHPEKNTCRIIPFTTDVSKCSRGMPEISLLWLRACGAHFGPNFISYICFAWLITIIYCNTSTCYVGLSTRVLPVITFVLFIKLLTVFNKVANIWIVPFSDLFNDPTQKIFL
jgi:hypothetical protein